MPKLPNLTQDYFVPHGQQVRRINANGEVVATTSSYHIAGVINNEIIRSYLYREWQKPTPAQAIQSLYLRWLQAGGDEDEKIKRAEIATIWIQLTLISETIGE